jgi:phospholipid/cholesterol/gamma-HCH transport system ATP-binding protein
MLEFNDISKSLGGRKILNKLNFSLERGETLVIVGPSGTGKSVTLKHILGIFTPDEGTIQYEGSDVLNLDSTGQKDYIKKFGVLFQSAALLAWLTVEENIALPLVENTKLSPDEIHERVQRVIKLVQLEGAEHKKPSEISGGMQKRAGLARAIITEPEIILYDEPTSGLDPVMSRHIDELILDMQKELGITSVVVTHDLHSAFAIGDRIAMLHEGAFGEISTPQDFVKSDKPYVKQFIQAQFTTGKVKEIPS